MGTVTAALAYTTCQTSIGEVYVAWTEQGIAAVASAMSAPGEFVATVRARTGFPPERADERQAELTATVERWLSGEPYGGPFDLNGLTDFARAVLEQTRAIPRGEVRSYAQIAAAIGRPAAVRAVGSALRRNPIPLLVPCHRVVRNDGRVGLYSNGGPEWKARLLRIEGVDVNGLAARAQAWRREI